MNQGRVPCVAIVGAGAAGLMAAEVLSPYVAAGRLRLEIFEQMPSAGRKILWAGKTGLNVTNDKPVPTFIQAYTPSQFVSPFIQAYPPSWVVTWLNELGVPTFVGSSGRVFPVAMKAAPFLRAWLGRLSKAGVVVHYRHRCVGLVDNHLSIQDNSDPVTSRDFTQSFDAIILACGGASYERLGSDGAWTAWFSKSQLTPFYASNVGVNCTWSAFMTPFFGQAIKRVRLWVADDVGEKSTVMGDVVVSHYGLESSTVYALNDRLRKCLLSGNAKLVMDLLPDVSFEKLHARLDGKAKQSVNTRWQKAGLDRTKIALIRECTPKTDWQDAKKMARHIKALAVTVTGLQGIEHAISTGGGLKCDELTADLQLRANPYVFACGEMLDWDAPTGGYLLSACFAMGRSCGQGVARFLGLACA